MICIAHPNFSGVKSRIMREMGHVANIRERGGVYRVLVGKLEGKRLLGSEMRL